MLKALRPDINSATTFTLETLDRGTNPQGANNAGDEADLDVEYTIGKSESVSMYRDDSCLLCYF